MLQDHFTVVCITSCRCLHNQLKSTVFPFPPASRNTFMSFLCSSKYFKPGRIFKSFFFSKSEAALSLSSLFLNHFEILVLSTLKLFYFSITFFVDKLFSLALISSALNLASWEILLRFCLAMLSPVRIGFDCFELSVVDCVEFFSIVNLFFSGSGSSCCFLSIVTILSTTPCLYFT